MRGFFGGRGRARALVSWSFVGCLSGGLGGSVDASDFGRVSKPMPRPTLEDKIPDLKRAREGARDRLGDPRCLAVLTDFESVNGGRLDLVLRSTGRTAQEQLDLLVFESGLGRPGCSRGQLAFTRIGSPVVSICLRPFTLLRPGEAGGRPHPRDAALARPGGEPPGERRHHRPGARALRSLTVLTSSRRPRRGFPPTTRTRTHSSCHRA